jgi:hypothetical protein
MEAKLCYKCTEYVNSLPVSVVTVYELETVVEIDEEMKLLSEQLYDLYTELREITEDTPEARMRKEAIYHGIECIKDELHKLYKLRQE